MENKWKDPRNRVCDKSFERENELINYFSILGTDDFEDMIHDEQKYILRIHNHLKNCRICSDCYIFLKERFSSDEFEKGCEEYFTPETFKRIAKNEKTLENLIEFETAINKLVNNIKELSSNENIL